MGTLRLTEAVARRGIGNRPGATQMNSGFHWPYGRREGVLPGVGASARRGSGGGAFQRVIFQDRLSEGYASRTSNDQSRDEYFCLSFNTATTTRDALDAVSCASLFNSDKGRYVTNGDMQAGYAEPFVYGTSRTTCARSTRTRSIRRVVTPTAWAATTTPTCSASAPTRWP
jgi:hypothetical protein